MGKEYMGIVRTTFVIDEEGNIEDIITNENVSDNLQLKNNENNNRRMKRSVESYQSSQNQLSHKNCVSHNSFNCNRITHINLSKANIILEPKQLL